MTETAKSITKQKSTEIEVAFVPTRGMLRWFETSVELGYTASITEVAKAANMNRASWYLWLERGGFVEWIDSEWKKYLLVNRWKLDAIGMKNAEKNYDYWRAMMERVGNLSPDTQFTAGKLTVREIIAEDYGKFGPK